mmetsp:Transcript_34041/g.112211  ORF Transcript_34041/g.112211 Transcript_34041/m.112211 type:complete len:479 (+) Transcript_34041:77-1513(+)
MLCVSARTSVELERVNRESVGHAAYREVVPRRCCSGAASRRRLVVPHRVTEQQLRDEGGGEGGEGASEGAGEAELADGEEDGHDDQIERDAKQVHDDAAVGVGQVLGAQSANEREVAADARLEGEEGADDRSERSARRKGSGAHRGGGAGEQHRHDVLGRDALDSGPKERGADHAADHEAGEDLAKGDVRAEGRLEGGRPLQHEDVHRPLEERLHRADERHPPVRRDGPHRIAHYAAARARRVGRAAPLGRAALVLAPRHGGDGGAEGEEANRELKGGGGAAEPGRGARELACGDGHEGVAKVGQREGLRKEGLAEGARLVLRHEPGLGRREEQGSAQPARHPAGVQQRQRLCARREGREGVQQRKGEGAALAAQRVDHPSDDGAEECRRREAGEEELCDGGGGHRGAVDHLGGVHLIKVRALQPVRHLVQPEDEQEAELQRTGRLARLGGVAAAGGADVARGGEGDNDAADGGEAKE